MRLAAVPDVYHRYRAPLRRSVRTTVAALLSFALADLLNIPQGFWAVFTSIIVVQASAGGSLQAAIDYLIGTVGGAAYGAAVALIVPHPDFWLTMLALAIAVIPLALAAALHQSFRVAPITAVLVLLVTQISAGPLQSAIARIVEIGLGSVVGVAVSLLVLPARAHALVAEAAGTVLGLLAEYTRAICAGIAAPWDETSMNQLDARIRAGLQRLESVAIEAHRERVSHLTDERNPEPIARTLRRMRNDLVMVSRALAQPLPEPFRGRLALPLGAVSEQLADYFATIGAAFARRADPPTLEPVTAALATFRSTMEEIHQTHAFEMLPADSASRIFGLAFALEQLNAHLDDLHSRAIEFKRPAPRQRRFGISRGRG